MSDQKNISEEMVKLIFTPLRESLSDTTKAIKESSNELRNLLEAISKHPDKTDLKQSSDHLVETIKYDFVHKTQVLEVLIITKLKETSDEILDKINDHHVHVMEHQDKQIDLILDNIDHIFKHLDKLVHKMDYLFFTIGITFTIALVAWGCIAYFFNIHLPPK